MKKKLIITTLVICMLTIGGVAANAYYCADNGYGAPIRSESKSCEKGGGGMRRHSQHGIVDGLLGFSKDQREKIKAIRDEEKVANEAMRNEMQEYREQMWKQTNAGIFDEDEIRAIAKKKADIQIEMHVVRAQMRSNIHALMTPEQQELANKMSLLRHNQKGGERRGPGRWRSHCF